MDISYDLQMDISYDHRLLYAYSCMYGHISLVIHLQKNYLKFNSLLKLTNQWHLYHSVLNCVLNLQCSGSFTYFSQREHMCDKEKAQIHTCSWLWMVTLERKYILISSLHTLQCQGHNLWCGKINFVFSLIAVFLLINVCIYIFAISKQPTLHMWHT